MISPAYITAARSHTCATTGRSCVTRTSESPKSLESPTQQLEDLRLHHDVERGRGLVGEQDLRTARERHGRSPPAGASRRRTRAGTAASGWPRYRPSRGARPRASHASFPSATSCSSIGSTICLPTVFTGLKAFMAPWKIIAMSFQRCGLTVSSPCSRMFSPSR